MKDEIKEILDKLYLDFEKARLTTLEYSDLRDYITNLQEENERLKEQLEYLRSGEYLNQVKWERDLNENLNQTLGIELEDYKSRIEKTIEYLHHFDSDEICENITGTANILLNILQGGGMK